MQSLISISLLQSCSIHSEGEGCLSMGSDRQNLLSFAMEILPTGFRFRPTDEEVVACYLAGGRQEFTVIPAIDICKFEPNQLPNQFKEKSIVRSNDPEGWFFCQQEQGQKAKRSTRKGYWKITATPTEVKSRDTKQIIGSRRTLTFYKKVQGGKDIKSDWIMHEYYIPNDNMRRSVICHVFLKADDNAISKQDVNLHHTPEIHVNQFNGSNLILGSGSISSPSISSANLMDFFLDSDPEDCNLSEDQIQMQMKLLFPACMPSNESIGHHRLCGAEDMEFSSSSEDQDYPSNLTYELQAYCEQDTIIRDNTQSHYVTKPKHHVLVLQSSNGTSESKLEGYGENSVPVKSMASYRSCLPHDRFLIGDYSSLSKKIKAKGEKKPATAASSLVTKNSNHGSGINCKTESMRFPDGACSSTPPIRYLVNLLVGIVLLIFFIDQVF